MAFKLTIGNVVEVPVKFDVKDGGATRSFSFALLASRMPEGELLAMSKEDDEATVADYLAGKITGWRGQTLVVGDEDGEPVPFSAESLRCMFSLSGLPGVVFRAYVAACGAKGKEKNS